VTGLSPRDWLGVGFAVLIAASVAVGFVIRQARRRAYEAYCFERGYQLESQCRGEEQRHVTTNPLFAEGWGQFWGFTITGSIRGVPFTAFEYDWETGPHISFSKSHAIAGTLWVLEGDDLPSFRDPDLRVARAGREVMLWSEGHLPSAKMLDEFLADGYRKYQQYSQV
jgi:hypothetical protein